MAHSSSRPSRAPAVVATVSGASVLIDAVTSANDREVERSVACHEAEATRWSAGGVWSVEEEVEKRAARGRKRRKFDGRTDR